MNIESIFYSLDGDKVLISDLTKKENIPIGEARIFEKIMGLRFAIRNYAINYQDQLFFILGQYFKNRFFEKNNVKYCIFAHTADDIAPNGFSIFEKAINKFKLLQTQFFGVSLHKCASIFQVFNLSKTLFENLSENDVILLVVSDVTFTGILQYIPGSTVLSDGAALLELRKSGSRCEILDVYLNEMGCFSKGYYGSHDEQLLFQSNYAANVVSSIEAVLNRCNIDISQIKKIFPHNVNVFSWKQVASKLKVPIDKFYLNNISKTAHCFGADPFINLADAKSEGILKVGDTIILVTVGLGATFSSMLLKY